MGYYTGFDLTVKNVGGEEQFNKLYFVMREHDFNGYKLIGYPFDDGTYNKQNDTAEFYHYDIVKWYDNNNDMCELSKMFPDMTFMLEGDGEETNDFWREYYKNGQSEFCAATLVYKTPERIKLDDDSN